ncbi:hypothetical protein IID20_00180 [Patescibacteria group bacterium]|nr:hypothetical protein [Patescibacteria group bacterium]
MKLKTIFQESIQIVWQNPILWLLGFFTALFANNEINLIIINFKRINNWIDQLITFKVLQIQWQQTLSNLDSGQIFTSTGIYYIIAALIFILLFLVLAFLAQIIIISSIKNIKKKNFSFTANFKKNKKFFWPVFSLYLIIFLITYGFLTFLNSSFLYQISIPIFIYIIFYLFIIFILSFILRFIIFFIILEKEKFLSAIKKGVIFFFKNWSITIKTSLALFLITILFALGLFLIYLGTALPFLLLLILTLQLNFIIGFWLIIVFWTFILGILFLVLSSIFSSFQFSAWILLFLKLRKLS